MKINMSGFLDRFNKAKERFMRQDKPQKKEFHAETAEQLANYLEEQKKKDFRQEMRGTDLPITYEDRAANGAFLFHLIEQVPDSKPMAREIKHLLRLRVGNPYVWTYENLSRYFNTDIVTIMRLEQRGKNMVKEAQTSGRFII